MQALLPKLTKRGLAQIFWCGGNIHAGRTVVVYSRPQASGVLGGASGKLKGLRSESFVKLVKSRHLSVKASPFAQSGVALLRICLQRLLM